MVAVRAHRATGGSHRSASHGRVSTGPEGWLLAERPVPAEGNEGEAGEVKYYFATLPADAPLERLAELAHARWAIEQFYEDAKGECGLGDYQGRRYDGMHRHLALSMLAYSFLIVQSVAAPPGARSAEPRARGPLGGPFPPVRRAALPAVHRQVLVWLPQDLVMWYIETDQIATFRPHRN